MSERQPYRYPDTLHVACIREVQLGDVADLVDDLATDYVGGATVRRETFRTASGGPGMAGAALMLIRGLTAKGILSELGKDAYRKTRDLLWQTYQKLRAYHTPSGYFFPLSVVLGKSAEGVYFIYGDGRSRADFENALMTMGHAADDVKDRLPGETDDAHMWWVEFRYDTASGAWELVHDEVDGQIRFAREWEPTPPGTDSRR